MSQIHLCQLTETEPNGGEAIAPPIELWPIFESEVNPPSSLEDPSRPPHYRLCFPLDDAKLQRHADPKAHRGAVGVYPEALTPVKIDKWDAEIATWVTHWHCIEGQMPV